MSQRGALGPKEVPMLGGVQKRCPCRAVPFASVGPLAPLSFLRAWVMLVLDHHRSCISVDKKRRLLQSEDFIYLVDQE